MFTGVKMKKLFIALMLFSLSAFATTTQLATNITTGATSIAIPTSLINGVDVMASIANTGAVAGVVSIYGNMTYSTSGGVLLATINLNGTNSDVEGADIQANYPFVYIVTSGITGTLNVWIRS